MNLYIEFAELQALERKPMTMRDWVDKLDQFLKASGRKLLDRAGTISAEVAKAKAEREYERYQALQDAKPRMIDASSGPRSETRLAIHAVVSSAASSFGDSSSVSHRVRGSDWAANGGTHSIVAECGTQPRLPACLSATDSVFKLLLDRRAGGPLGDPVVDVADDVGALELRQLDAAVLRLAGLLLAAAEKTGTAVAIQNAIVHVEAAR